MYKTVCLCVYMYKCLYKTVVWCCMVVCICVCGGGVGWGERVCVCMSMCTYISMIETASLCVCMYKGITLFVCVSCVCV